jgi:hypothetical protein
MREELDLDGCAAVDEEVTRDWGSDMKSKKPRSAKLQALLAHVEISTTIATSALITTKKPTGMGE